MPSVFVRKNSTADYAPLKSPHQDPRRNSRRTVDVTFFSMGVLVLGLIALSSVSFMAGQHLSPQSTAEILNLTSYAHVFRYNRTFSERPNATTDKAWIDLFPKQGGFFKHPQLAPKRSTFATFHQLHCLDGIRHGYWTLFDIAMEGKKLNESELPFHASAPHIRHCIDLLRNVLTCQPDLTLEVKDDKLGGVTGFGTEHVCLDWKELVDWTSKWETYQQSHPGKKLHDSESEHHAHGSEHGLKE